MTNTIQRIDPLFFIFLVCNHNIFMRNPFLFQSRKKIISTNNIRCRISGPEYVHLFNFQSIHLSTYDLILYSKLVWLRDGHVYPPLYVVISRVLPRVNQSFPNHHVLIKNSSLLCAFLGL